MRLQLSNVVCTGDNLWVGGTLRRLSDGPRKGGRATVSVGEASRGKAGLGQRLEESVSGLAEFKGLHAALHSVQERARDITRAISQCRAEREQAIALKAQAEQRLQQIENAKARAAVLEAELATPRPERDDFDYLAKALGPDEIQLCEIQSAGPRVSSILNALLEACFDNKF